MQKENGPSVSREVYSYTLLSFYCKSVASHCSCEKLASFECPCNIYSASLHPDKSCLVAGGEDFRLFKFDYKTGKELGKSIIHKPPFKLIMIWRAGKLEEHENA